MINKNKSYLLWFYFLALSLSSVYADAGLISDSSGGVIGYSLESDQYRLPEEDAEESIYDPSLLQVYESY